MTAQTDRLFRALLAAVESMHEPERIRPYLRRLGAHHTQRHGVSDELYPYVGQALIRATREAGTGWSTVIGSAWAGVYLWLSGEMTAGAHQAAAGGRPR